MHGVHSISKKSNRLGTIFSKSLLRVSFSDADRLTDDTHDWTIGFQPRSASET